ncbi:MAG: RNA polymerase sigma factor [Arenicella sp.]|nr:RNA polymerase sigma factor [Arenicella sp.]
MTRKPFSSVSTNTKSVAGNCSPSDYQIVKLVREGHVEQYQVLVRRYNQRLFRIARSILLDDQLAMDAVQNAHINAYKHIPKYQGNTGFLTWISTIARNEALMLLRKIKSEKLVELNENDSLTVVPINGDSIKDTQRDPEDEFANTELRAILNSNIDSLPEHFREAFVMRCVEGFSVRETSDILGVNAATIKTRVFRAKTLLHDRIASKYGAKIYEIGGCHCDQIVVNVMRLIVA